MDINNFTNWELDAKLSFFDSKDFSILYDVSENDLHQILKTIIINLEENPYVRKQGLQLYINLALRGKFRSLRKVIGLLLDDMLCCEDRFILMCLLKNLWLFYESEKVDIDKFYNSFENVDSELMAEKHMALGYIYAYKAAESSTQEDFTLHINNMRENLIKARSCIENRIDADFFIEFSNILFSINGNSPKIEICILKRNIKEYCDNSLSPEDYLFHNNIYNILVNTLQLTQNKPTKWIDYKHEFSNLYLNWMQIKEIGIANQLLKRNIITAISSGVVKSYITPYLKNNFLQEKLRIENCIEQVGVNSKLGQFLAVILSVLPADEDVNIIKIREALMTLDCSFSEREIDCIISKEDALELLKKNISAVQKDTFDYVNSKLEHSLSELITNNLYFDASEDQRNTFIRALLSVTLNVADQTFSGVSATGKNAGEVDLLIRDINNLPFCYIEAMNLTSVDKKYISRHVTKIFKYDSCGCKNDYIICYVKIVDFESFWNKYVEYIKTIDVGMSINSSHEEPSKYSNIKKYKISYNRNGTEINLYHIAVLIFSNAN